MSRIAQLEELLKADTGDPFLYFALAKEYEQAGQPELSIEKYEYLINNFPDYNGTYYHFGKLLENQGEVEAAKTIYRQGINIAGELSEQHTLAELKTALVNIELEL